MRAFLLAAMMIFASIAPASAVDGEDAARDVIESQLDAFQNADVDRAFEFAAPHIKRMFRNPRIFGRMVRQGYPMVWAPFSTEFLGAEENPNGHLQRLRIIDLKGTSWIAEYQMMLVDGEWLIGGVRIIRDVETGV